MRWVFIQVMQFDALECHQIRLGNRCVVRSEALLPCLLLLEHLREAPGREDMEGVAIDLLGLSSGVLDLKLHFLHCLHELVLDHTFSNDLSHCVLLDRCDTAGHELEQAVGLVETDIENFLPQVLQDAEVEED